MSGYRSIAAPVRLVFIGCGRATLMHSRTLRGFGVERYYASRDPAHASACSEALGRCGMVRLL